MISNYFGYFTTKDQSRNKINSTDYNNFRLIYFNDYTEIYASLSDKNLYYGEFDNTFWIIAGIGLIEKDLKLKIANKDDWEKCIRGNHFPDFGHYSISIIKNNTLRLINDPTGTRTIYYSYTCNDIYFSTRINDLSKLSGKNSPDIANIGSFYILSANLNNGTEIKNIKKLMYDEELIINKNNFSIKKENNIKKSMKKYDKLPFNHLFSNYLSSLSENNISLALSGGFDSRYIMSILLKNNIPFQTFTFGCKTELDSLIAMKISNVCNIKHQLFDNYSKSGLIEKIEHYLSFNPFNPSMHRIPYLYNYESTKFQNQFIIDGAFGEFYSKRFFVKWRILNEFGINDSEMIYKLISQSAPTIFNGEIKTLFENNALNSFINLFKEFSKDPYLNHPIDYIFFKYIYSNHWSREQAFMDEYICSCIPFLQAPIIANFQKSRSHIYSKNIKQNARILSKYPFIKKNSRLPFSDIERIIAKIFYTIKRQDSDSYNTKDICEFYNISYIKEYIYDSIISSEFRNSSLLNKKYIIDCVNQFYKKKDINTISIVQTYLSFIATKHIAH